MKLKRVIILFVVIANIGFILSIYYMFFHERVSFDDSKRPRFDDKISKIEIGPGHWKSKEVIYDFYKDFDTILDNNINIDSIQNIIKISRPTLTKLSSTKEWVDFYFYNQDEVFLELTLIKNYENEVFFEFEGDKYDGKKLENYLISNVVELDYEN